VKDGVVPLKEKSIVRAPPSSPAAHETHADCMAVLQDGTQDWAFPDLPRFLPSRADKSF
jgi:hypothetical protein